MSTTQPTSDGRRPLRVAIVHYRDDAVMGGSLRVGETIANHVSPSKVEAHLVFAYGGPGPVAEKARVPCHFIGAKGPKDFPAWGRARSLVRALDPDLIHYQDAVIWLRTALLGTRYKSLLHVHGRHIPQYVSRKNRLLGHAFMRKIDAHACISHGARASLLSFGLMRPESSFVVHNSVEVGRFSNACDRAGARARLGLPADALLLGMVCRMMWAKGCVDLLSLIERLPARWHGVLCGDGPQLPELRRLCEERGLTRRVHFLYSQGDVAPVYASLDAYAFLSRYEPFGLVLAEAMAAGVPVFGLRGDGEYAEAQYPLVTPENAVFVERHGGVNQESPESPAVLDALARRIEHFGDHPGEYAAMIDKARAWVAARFDAPVQAEAMTELYERVASGRAAAGQARFSS